MKRCYKYLLAAGLAIAGMAAPAAAMQLPAEPSAEQTQTISAEELYYKGIENSMQGKPELAFNCFGQAAAKGHAKAQCALGMCYYMGLGTRQDHNVAFNWFSKSAEQEEPVAQCQLGLMYAKGQGTQQDYAQAVKWLSKSAEQGNAEAKSLLERYSVMVNGSQQAQATNHDEVQATNHDSAEASAPQEAAPQAVDNNIYSMNDVQQKPEFPGGEQALYQWLSQNMIYPEEAAEEGASGRVVVGFTVSKTGAIENVRVIRGKHPALDKEAVRVVMSMPNWKPGRDKGQPVKVDFTLPITFSMEGR